MRRRSKIVFCHHVVILSIPCWVKGSIAPWMDINWDTCIMQCMYGVTCLLGYTSVNLWTNAFDFDSKFACSAVRSSCRTESIRFTSKRSCHNACTSSQSGISGNVATMSSLLNTINFSGPVRVRHFSFLDSRLIQKENPLIPSVFKVLSYFLIYCSCSRLFTLIAFSILSRHFSSNKRRSTSTSATQRNV